MPEPAPIIPPVTFEGDFALPARFPLEAGGVLGNASLHYVLYGSINAARDNVVFVCHALSGSAQVAEWWPAIFSPEGPITPGSAILGVNILGSCYGSTGPTSLDLATGKPYAATFPLVSIRDIVRAEALLLDHLQIPQLRLAIGASIGGMQVLELAIQFPERVAKGIIIGVATLGAMGLGWNHLQRQAILLDPDFKEGNYLPSEPPHRGLAHARALAVCTYKSTELFDERFARNPNRTGPSPYTDAPYADAPKPRFDIAGYLDHQGLKFNRRFDANSYLAITRFMDLFDPLRNNPDAYTRIQAELTFIGISSDLLFPPADVAALAASISAAGARCHYRELLSNHGHDAFLAEPRQLLTLLRSTTTQPPQTELKNSETR